MIFRHRETDNPYNKIAERIKLDLITRFKEKGIKISNIHIDTDSGNLNLSISIKEGK